MLRDIRMYDDDFTPKEAALVFVWSRMRVVDERPPKSKVRLIQLSFEDFLEGLVRISTIKCLPMDEDIFDAGVEDAGEFIEKMRDERPDEYKRWLSDHMREWDAPLPQPIFRLVEHLCHFVVRSVETTVIRAGKRFAANDLLLTQAECKAFRELNAVLYSEHKAR